MIENGIGIIELEGAVMQQLIDLRNKNKFYNEELNNVRMDLGISAAIHNLWEM